MKLFLRIALFRSNLTKFAQIQAKSRKHIQRQNGQQDFKIYSEKIQNLEIPGFE